MTIIKGIIQKGQGGASANLKTQLPLIAADFPEVKSCFCGTLNMGLEKGLLILTADHRTRPINWHPDHAPGEIFDLLRIQIEAPAGDKIFPAWIYIAYNSDHRKNIKTHEVIATQLPISVGDRCNILIDRPSLELPYRACPIVVVP